MNDFTKGFIKRAQESGLDEPAAFQLAKEAGILGGIGNFAHDMFVKPVTSTINDAGRTAQFLAKGQFGRAGKAFGSTLGNAALTGLTYFPGTGVGAIAGRAALKGGTMALRAGASGAGRMGMRSAINAGAAGTTSRIARPLMQAGSKMQSAQGGLQNMATRMGGWQQAAANKSMQGLDAMAGKAQGMWGAAKSSYQAGRTGMPAVAPGPIKPNFVSNFTNNAVNNAAAPGAGLRARAMGNAVKYAPATVATDTALSREPYDPSKDMRIEEYWKV